MYQDSITNFASAGEHNDTHTPDAVRRFPERSGHGAYIGFSDLLMFTAEAHADSSRARSFLSAPWCLPHFSMWQTETGS